MTWQDRIVKAHTSVTDQVSHFHRLNSERYFVWQEDGSNDLSANGNHVERCMTGTTDLYTKQEFDPWVEMLGASLSRYGIAWQMLSVQYENETGFFHYEWSWEVPY